MTQSRNLASFVKLMIGFGLLFAISASAGLFWLNYAPMSTPGEPHPARIGQAIPNFHLNNLSGNQVSLEDYLGRPVLINFWATWCPPCKREMPGLNAFYRQNREDGFIILAVNVGETRDQASAFAEEYQLEFPVLLDPNYELADRLMVDDYPTSIMIGRDGVVKYIHIGYFSPDDLKLKLLPLIE